jgi:hypothetical protein
VGPDLSALAAQLAGGSDAKTDASTDCVAADVEWLREFADHFDKLLAAAERVAQERKS